MSSLMSAHGVALATAMAVSGTFILIAVCRQKPLSTAAQLTADDDRNPTSARCNLRSCISSDERRRERGNRKSKKKKRVRFAKDVVVEFDKESEEILDFGGRGGAAEVGGGMPANRAALYQGILQDRLQRVA